MAGEVPGERADRLRGRRAAWAHPFESAEGASQLVERQAGQDGLGPLVRFQRALAELRVRGRMDMLGAVVVVEDLLAVGEVPTHHVPGPLGAVGHQGKPDLVPGDA